jgi:hypothetical protein
MAVNGFSVRCFVRLRSCLGDQAVYKSGTLISGLLFIIIRGAMEWGGYRTSGIHVF